MAARNGRSRGTMIRKGSLALLLVVLPATRLLAGQLLEDMRNTTQAPNWDQSADFAQDQRSRSGNACTARLGQQLVACLAG